jgi:hypothetical protein
MCGTAAAASSLLTVTRTISEPASARAATCSMVPGNVRRVGVGHRLHDDRNLPADANLPDFDRGCFSALNLRHKHLGISITPKKSTLAYANANRPWELYESIFMQLLEKCQSETAAHSRRKFRFKNKLMSLDASIIELSATMFDWAKYTQQKGAIKLHLLLDHDGYLPSFAVVTEGKYSELNVARDLRLKAGTILAVDRGYNDYVWFRQLTRDGVFFVTRMKSNTVYTTVEVRAVPEKGNVLHDQIISVPFGGKKGEAPVLFRRIEYWNEDKQEILVFFTNLLHLAASTVAAIYKDRWQIELFFKALKQTAKVKSFLGTSANAVKTQIWTALIAMLILKYLQMKSSFGWSLSNLAALLRQQLFIYRDLWVWLNTPLEGPQLQRTSANNYRCP